ncbi:hypothetical protein DFJ63DRAFT_315818 [Scheffersomyces coipomensis]|uniref:uncharacterized protein n=1 Tax=Scheffersomyces coipomensis TaxID=1788519 RepID=UPI00315CEE92
MSLDAIRRQVNDVPDYYILSAQQEFENSTNVKLLNPRVIDEEFNYKKHIFSKLKFLYLEQETRDKFLRRISEISSVELEEDKHGEWNDIANIERQTGESKVILKSLKSEMNNKIKNLDQLCEDNIELYHQYIDKVDDSKRLIHDIDDITQEIDQILDEFDDQEFIQDITNNNNNSTDDIDLSNIIEKSRALVDEQTQQLNSLQQEIDHQQSQYEKKCTHHTNLLHKSQDLKEIIKSYSDLESNDIETNQQNNKKLHDKFQNYGKWCKEMNDVIIKLSNITNIKLKLTKKNNFYLIIDNSKRIIYTHHWKIIKIEGFKNESSTNQFIKFVNQLNLTEDLFLSALVEFIQDDQTRL